MPRFEPFPAVRYDASRVEIADVVAPPYDVIGPAERAGLEARSAHNVVHVDLARGQGGKDRYQSAQSRFAEWLADGTLTVDEQPGFYLYRMGWSDSLGRLHQTSGVLGALELDPTGSGAVLPHERTMTRPMDDRLRQLRACRTNLSPIWGLSLGDGLVSRWEPEGPPLVRCTDDEGVHHRIWSVTSPAAISAITASVAAGPVVIADGHHRYETALAYRSEQRAANGDVPGPHDLLLAYVVDLVDGDVGVGPIHRMLSGLPAGASVAGAVADAFLVEALGPVPPDLLARIDAGGALGLVEGDEAFLLHPREGTDTTPGSSTDSELVEAALASLPAHTLAHHHDPTHVMGMVDKGEVQAAVLLRPPTIPQIEAAARAGRRLPEKTTFFYPKPRTGLVFRRLIGGPPSEDPPITV